MIYITNTTYTESIPRGTVCNVTDCDLTISSNSSHTLMITCGLIHLGMV